MHVGAVIGGLVCLGVTASCAAFGTADSAQPTDASVEAGADAGGGGADGGTPCRLDAPFDAPTFVPGLESVDGYAPRFSADELESYFQALGRDGSHDIFAARRAKASDAFGPPSDVVGTMVNSPMEDGNPMLSADGRLLVFTSNRTGGPGGFDLFMATRTTPTAVLGNVARIAELSMSGDESEPYLSADGKELWFNRGAATGPGDIFHSVAQAGGWGPPVAVAELNSAADESLPVISADGGTIYFASNRDGKVAGIWKASRAHATDPFSIPTKVTELEAAVEQHPSWLSLDGCRLYYSRGHDPSRMYIASKPR